MSFSFATCDPVRALEFINREMSVTKEEIPELLSLIEQDIIRVTDPMMHGVVQFQLGKKGTDADLPAIHAALEPIKKKQEEPK